MKPGSNEFQALTQLVVWECKRVGRDWQAQGIHAAIVRLFEEDPQRTLSDVHVSAVAAVGDPKALTPVAIGWAQYRAGTPKPAARPDERCCACQAPDAEACRKQQADVPLERRFVHDYHPRSRRHG